MTWGEAIRLTRILSADPSSQVCTAVNGWSYPFSREAIVLADLYDLQHASKARRKPQPYSRPWRDRSSTRTKPDADLTQAEIIAALRRAGHTAKLPSHLAHIEAEVTDG